MLLSEVPQAVFVQWKHKEEFLFFHALQMEEFLQIKYTERETRNDVI